MMAAPTVRERVKTFFSKNLFFAAKKLIKATAKLLWPLLTLDSRELGLI